MADPTTKTRITKRRRHRVDGKAIRGPAPEALRRGVAIPAIPRERDGATMNDDSPAKPSRIEP